jgi:iron complex transport system permease protein
MVNVQNHATKRGPVTLRRGLIISSALALVLLVIGMVALCLGSEPISLGTIWRLIVDRILGHEMGRTPHEVILFEVRLPRIVLGLIAGAGLAVAGAMLQALLRNPLAEPYVLGISSGSALGAIAALLWATTFPLARPLSAFTGAMTTMLFVYTLSRGKTGVSMERLILAGVIASTFLWSTIALLLTTIPNPDLRGITFWMMGNLSGGGNGLLAFIGGAIAITATLAYLHAGSLNLLMVGEEDARVFGVHVERVKTVAYVLASLLTGFVVSVAGSIGFVGLIVPHIVRLAWGSDNRLVIPAAALLGAIFVITADTLARTVIAPRELPVGAVTAIVGAPLFISLLRKA